MKKTNYNLISLLKKNDAQNDLQEDVKRRTTKEVDYD